MKTENKTPQEDIAHTYPKHECNDIRHSIHFNAEKYTGAKCGICDKITEFKWKVEGGGTVTDGLRVLLNDLQDLADRNTEVYHHELKQLWNNLSEEINQIDKLSICEAGLLNKIKSYEGIVEFNLKTITETQDFLTTMIEKRDALQSQLSNMAEAKWIDYNSPPDHSGEILLLTESLSQYIGFYKKGRNLYTVYGIEKKELEDVNITHWMPLPIPVLSTYNKDK